MNREVFLSLLALDSYNRGYGANINGLSEEGKIGSATIRTFGLNEQDGWEAAGFYAIAYVWNDETIISIRGTNFPTGAGTLFEDVGEVAEFLGTDFSEGWSIFTGLGAASQANLAREFYKSVTGLDFYVGPVGLVPTGVTLTGHSLGGGLAGYISSRTFVPAEIFDPVPFGAFAYQSAFSDALAATATEYFGDLESLADVLAAVAEIVLSENIPGGTSTWQDFVDTLADNISERIPDFSHVTGSSLAGEVASMIENLQIVAGGVLLNTGPFGALALQQLLQGAITQIDHERDDIDQVGNRGLPSGSLSSAIDLHSMASLTVMLFGQEQWSAEGGLSSWEAAIARILPATADSTLAARFGLGPNSGTLEAGSQLAGMIAYSVLDSDTSTDLVFGNTGVRALFNDADDLGRELTRLPDALAGATVDLLGASVAEFAGLLAVNRIEKAKDGDALRGILEVGDTENYLRVNISNEDWGAYDREDKSFNYRGLKPAQLVQDLLTTYIGSDGSAGGSAAGLRVAFNEWLFTAGAGETSVTPLTTAADLIDWVTFSFGTPTLYGAGPDNKYDGLQLIVGLDTNQSDGNSSGYNNTIIGLPAIVIAGDGGSTLRGSGGNDAFVTGTGSDTIEGGGGSDFFAPGSGYNVIWGGLTSGDGDHFAVDTVVLSETAGIFNLLYEDNELSVYGANGTNILHDIEAVRLEGQSIALRIGDSISADANLTVYAGGGGTQFINGFAASSGLEVILDNSSGTVTDLQTGGQIRLSGFHTNITGSGFDDKISDNSSEQKIIDGGKGSDRIDVGGSSGSTILFGGEGADEIIGGEASDVIVDHAYRQDDLRTVALTDAGFSVERLGYGAITAGAGDDLIVVGRDFPGSRPVGAVDYGAIGAGFYLDPGAGDDIVNLVGAEGAYYYRYGAGDGNDLVHVNSVVSTQEVGIQPDDTVVLFSRYAVRPDIDFDLSDYNSSDISVNFAISYTYTLEKGTEDILNSTEWPDTATEIGGTLTISLADGGSIVLDDYVFTYEGFLPDLLSSSGDDADITQTDVFGLGRLPWRIDTADGGPVTITFSEASAARAPGEMFVASTSLTQTPSQGDNDLIVGEQSLIGGEGTDRLTVNWALDSLTSTLDGTMITISDRWGLIGTTTLTDFEEIYVAAEGKTYTVQEFHAELNSRGHGPDIVGTEEDDDLSGTAGRDRIYGLTDDDVLSGLVGDDLLDGGLGADEMSGGTGDDVFIVDDEDDIVVEDLGEGNDLVRASIDYTLGANVERLDLLDGALEGLGNALANRITGNEADNTLAGLDGDDILFGLGGEDALSGGDGRDQLFGGEGDDALEGGAGNDTIVGGLGADTMIGGGGDDTYIVDDAGDTVTELAAEGHDTVLVALEIFQTPDNVERVIMQDGAIEATAGAGGTEIQGNALDNFLWGEAGDDRLYGFEGDDEIYGDGGNDILDAGNGTNYVEGGDGDDRIAAGSGDDELYGDAGDDIINAGTGSNYVEGGGGNDVIHGGNAVTVFDPPYGFASQYDILDGGDGDDTLLGYAGDDELYGGEGDDVLLGGGGWDILIGDAGNDLIVGDGKATLADVGAFISSNDSGYTPDDEDIVYYTGNREDFTISALGNNWFRIDSTNNGEPEVDYVVNVETIGFDQYDPITGEYLDTDYVSLLSEDASFSVATYLYQIGGSEAEYSVALESGGLAPAWLSLVDGHVTGTPPENFVGQVSLLVSGATSTWSDQEVLKLEFFPANDAPVVQGLVTDVALDLGQGFLFDISELTFSDVDGDALAITATLADGSPLPAWLSFDGSEFSGTAPASDPGPFAIAVHASDGAAQVDSAFGLSFAEALNRTAREGEVRLDTAGWDDTAVADSGRTLISTDDEPRVRRHARRSPIAHAEFHEGPTGVGIVSAYQAGRVYDGRKNFDVEAGQPDYSRRLLPTWQSYSRLVEANDPAASGISARKTVSGTSGGPVSLPSSEGDRSGPPYAVDDFSMNPDILRRLANMRQDLATFGSEGAGALHALRQDQLQVMDWYA